MISACAICGSVVLFAAILSMIGRAVRVINRSRGGFDE